MIIQSATVSNSTNPYEYAWRELKRFYNVRTVTKILMDLQQIPERQKSNVMKQAEQIRLCLSLAQDYCDAAQAVSLTTRPVLMYYASMNMALAEILFKQNGDSSLDRARSEHKHHGLVGTVGNHEAHDPISISGNQLRARPMINSVTTDRHGTFELWHRSARQHPIYGIGTDAVIGVDRHMQLTVPNDNRMPLIPETGITFLECLKYIPTMASTIASYNVNSMLLRGKQSHSFNKQYYTINTIIHPNEKELVDACLEMFEYHPASVPNVNCELKSGGAAITYKREISSLYPSRLPDCMNGEDGQSYFHTSILPLNEFGYLYVALFIAGTYARYYPDKWIKDIENSSDLSILIDELTLDAMRRIPVLLLSELKRSVIVFDK